MVSPQNWQQIALDDEVPQVHASAWIAPGARVVGNVRLGEEVGVFYGAVLRAEVASIRVRERTNIQDNCVLHAGLEHSVDVGAGVTIGHSAIVHGCTVGDDVLVGMGATLLNDCVIGSETVIGAGTLVPEGAVIPPGSLVIGSPARVVRELDAQERSAIRAAAEHYLDLMSRHRRASSVSADSRENDQSGHDHEPHG